MSGGRRWPAATATRRIFPTNSATSRGSRLEPTCPATAHPSITWPWTSQFTFLQDATPARFETLWGVIRQLTDRKEWKFFGVLPKADRAPGDRVVGRARPARRAARGLRHRDGRARRRGAERRRPRRAARLRRRRVRPAPGAHADPPGGQRQPRRSHRGLALRPADRGVRASAGHGPPRGPDAHQRPHRGARLRPRHDRAAAVDLDGLHRRRPGRDDRRPRVRRWCSFAYAWWAPLVLGGAWLATHWLLRESAVWRDRNTDEVRARAARRRLRLPARRRPAGRQGAAPVRPRRLDDRSLRRPPHAAARAAVRGDAAAREAGAVEPAARARRQRRRVLVARRRRRRRPPRPSPRSSCSRRARSARR